MKLVINKCYGGFSLSHAAVMAYAERKGIKIRSYTNARKADGSMDFGRLAPYDGGCDTFTLHYTTADLAEDGSIPNDAHFSDRDIKRDDPDLIAVVESLGEKADGDYAELRIIEIPDGVEWQINEYDGMESVDEKHRSWS